MREAAERGAPGDRTAAPLGVQLEPAAAAAGDAELFRFSFGGGTADAAAGVFPVHLEPLDAEPPDEVWYTAGEVGGNEIDDICLRASHDHLVLHLRCEPGGGSPLDELAYGAYRRLIELARRRGYPHLLRVWNLFPGINRGTGDIERYRVFSLGRARALDALGYRDRRLPAGTAIGSGADTPLTITLLAARGPCRALENPRQTSAYRYPRQFGPRSPSFSRSVLLEGGAVRQLIVSGTASIVGHRSLHAGDVTEQFAETFRNIAALRKRALALCGGERQPAAASLRIYLRRREDLPRVKALLARSLAAGDRIVCLRGDICRRELNLEVEGAYFF